MMPVQTDHESVQNGQEPTSLETYFEQFRRGIIGYETEFDSPYGRKRIVYADWIASGRLYGPIERRMTETFGPYVGNTHSESSVTGTTMTRAYHMAHKAIKRHVNAGPDDVIITCGTGMTGAINKLHRILGLRIPDRLEQYVNVPASERPVVFCTHMEHHSNQTTWLETLADVVCLDPDEQGLVDPTALRDAIEQYANGRKIIGAFTSCSNVTGIESPYRELARIIHEHGGEISVQSKLGSGSCFTVHIPLAAAG